jgi:hypothetical protein
VGKVGREPSNPCKYWVFAGHFGVSKVAKWPEKVAKCPLFSPSAHFQNTKVAKKYNLELPKVGADLAAKMARILF